MKRPRTNPNHNHAAIPRRLPGACLLLALAALCLGPLPARAAITLNSTNSAATAGAQPSLTWSHTVASGTNRILIVGLSFESAQATNVTYGGSPLTLVGRSAVLHTVEIWRLLNPPVGTASIVANFSASREVIGGSTAFNGVDQISPTGSFVGNGADNDNPFVTVSSAPGELVLDTFYMDELTVTPSVGPGQSQHWFITSTRYGAGSTEPGAASVTMSWNMTAGEEWELGAVPLKPAMAAVQGTVFEDPNYGGGSGRSLAASSGVGRDGARVELYDASGNFISFTNTTGGGSYTFASLPPGTNIVRVVNNTVTSSRPGYAPGLLPVQTFRSHATNGSPVNVTDRVGGEIPHLADAGNGATTLAALTNASITVQSIATVTLGTSPITNLDFGFNFNTIVNTNDSGQGSFRQFLINANTLGGEGSLAQSGSTKNFANGNVSLPTGKESSLFMISDGNPHPGLRAGLPNQLLAGVARITPLTQFPTIDGPNTVLDGTTQTVNVGDNNAGEGGNPEIAGKSVGTGPDGIEGTGDEGQLPSYYRPEVEINGNNLGTVLRPNGDGVVVKGFAIYNGSGASPSTVGAIQIRGGTGNIIAANFIGVRADNSDPGAGSRVANGVDTFAGDTLIMGNFIAYTEDIPIDINTPTIVASNDIYSVSLLNPNDDGITAERTTGEAIAVTRNRVDKIPAYAFEGWRATGPFTITENSFSRTGQGGGDEIGSIHVMGSGSTVRHNVITTSVGAGIVVAERAVSTERNLLSQNAIYNNGGPSIDIDVTTTGAGSSPQGDGVTPNDGATANTLPNIAMDYPVITNALLVGSVVRLQGFVGTPSSLLAAVHTLEIFKADNDGNNNGEIIAGDTLSVAHGEGRWFVGSCMTAADGTFNCDLVIPASVSISVGDFLSGTATDVNNNTSEFGANAAVMPTTGVAGTVFEDANYGGGAGRNLTDSGGTGQNGARVEIYDATGNFIATTTTDGSGVYTFTGLMPGTNIVRVVNSTVTSSRPGYVGGLLPVQTFRVEATNGTASDVINRVGGELPRLIDAGNGSTTLAALTNFTTTVQSLSTVVLDTNGLSSVDFGFNFDTIVNTNNSGQGSVRQFLINANTLGNAGLAQAGQTSGKEVSLFMIPDGTAHPGLRAGLVSQLTAGVARISPTTALPIIDDPDTTLDGSTQTANVGNSNPATFGTGGTVGVDELALTQVNGPEVEIRDGATLPIGIQIQANDVTVRGLAVLGFGSADGDGAIRIEDTITGTLIENNLLGSSATSLTDPGTGLRNWAGIDSEGADNGRIQNNMVAFSARYGIFLGPDSANWTLSGNEILNSGMETTDGDGITVNGAPANTISGNLVTGSSSQGIVVTVAGSTGNTFENNSVMGNGVGTTGGLVQSAGITLRSTAGPSLFDRNLVRTNYGAGLAVNNGATGIQLTRNSFFENGTINSRNGGAPTTQIGIDLNSPSDNANIGTSPYYTTNELADSDSGGNNLLNFPVLETAALNGTTLLLTGWARPNSVIELFISDGDPRGFGEGKTYLVTLTEGSGDDTDTSSSSYGPAPLNGLTQGTDNTARFSFSISVPAGVTTGTTLTATATDGANNTSEFSGIVTVQAAVGISGTVFEDPNYGGGTGRNLTGSSGVGRDSARVELYDGAGNFISFTNTTGGGTYAFNNLMAGTNILRVVNSTVTSSRPGYTPGLLPVQTFRAEATNSTVTDVTDRVGGEIPTLIDAGNGATTLSSLTNATTTVQSISTLVLTTNSLTGVDFGYNFDTIVNTNDSGQGSFRQFLINANTLGNAGLAQAGQTAGKEVSLFMISDGAAHPGLRAGLVSQLTAGVALIVPSNLLPAIADPDTTIDGGTQTSNVGDNNSGQLGAGGTVGVDALPLAQVNRPEIQIHNNRATGIINRGIDVRADNTTIRNLAIYGFGTTPNTDGHANIQVTNNVSGSLIQQNIIGSSALSFSDPGASTRSGGDNVRATSAGSGTLQNNLIGFASGQGAIVRNGTGGWLFEGNEVRGNALGNAELDGIDFSSTGNCTARGNLLIANNGCGADAAASPGGNTHVNNTISGNGTGTDPNVETAGIRVWGAGSTLDRNIISTNFGPGIMVVSTASTINITKNSIFLNGTILNQLGAGPSGEIGIDLLNPTDNASIGSPPFYSLNDPGDSDTGANSLLNFPILDTATTDGANLLLTGWSPAGAIIELFISDGDATGFGEGETYLVTMTEGSGDDSDSSSSLYGPGPINGLAQGSNTTTRFSFSISLPPGVTDGTKLTATARDGSDNTSEFSGVVAVAPSYSLAGTVFEDVNYGGGAGRTLAGSSGVGRDGARIELYDGAGNFISFTNTTGGGSYAFSNIPAGTNVLRVVNDTVSSSRPGYVAGLLPVQTFRTDATNSTVTDVTDHVGGEIPTLVDAGNGATTLSALTNATTTVQSISTLVLTTNDLTGVDFGFNFNTIVNTNDSGQGSLRQLISNANTLGNAGLAQSGRPASIDNAIFMISDGITRPGLNSGYPSQFPAGVATINPATAFAAVTDPAVFDATLQPGYVDQPIIEISGASAGASVSGFEITAGGTTVRGFAINLFNDSAIRLTGSGDNVVQANYLGTDTAGTTAKTNNQQGIYISSAANLVGGTNPSDRNVLSGNRLRGILIAGAGAVSNIVQGNYVGVTADGNSALPNDIGIYLSGAPDNIVGAGATNVISGNTQIGLYLVGAGTTGSQIQGNIIGLNAAASSPLPNGSQGIDVLTGASGNTIGGTNPGQGNIISANGNAGLRIASGNNNRIQRNSIYGNTGLGIELGTSDGVTPNNGALGAGPNDDMDYPVFTSVSLDGTTMMMTGFVGSAPGQPAFANAIIDIFKSDNTPADQDGEIILGDAQSVPHGEGRTYLGSITTDANGNFNTNLTVSGLAVGEMVTATAIAASGNSSEFGANAVVTGLADLLVLKAGETNVVAGTNFIYTVTLTNAGPSTASNVVVIDTLPTNVVFVSASSGGSLSNNIVSWPTLTNVPNAFSTNFTVTVTAPTSGSFTNFASTTADTADPTPANNDGSDSASQVFTTIGELADIITLKSGETNVVAGTNFIYTITLTNAGPSTASNVLVIDTLPTNVVLVSASSGGTLSNNVVSWPTLTNVPNLFSTNFTVTVTAPASGSFTNFASSTSLTLDPDQDNNNGTNATGRVATTITPMADIITLKSGETNVVAGTNFIYTLTLTNAGPSTASNVVVIDTLPTNVVFVSASSGGTLSNNVVSWPTLTNIPNAFSTNFTVTVTAPTTGSFTNFASGSTTTADPDPTNNNGSSSAGQVFTSVGELADIITLKSGETNVVAGTNFIYTVTLTNAGPSTASNVLVIDTLPTNVVFVSASSGGSLSNNIVSWPTLTNIPNAFSTNFTVTVTAPTTGSFTNFASGSTSTDDPDPTNNDGSSTAGQVFTTIGELADIITLKSGETNVVAGTNFIYTVTLTNAGPSTASNVVVIDTLPTNTVFVSASSGGTLSNNIVTWPTLTSIPNLFSTNFTVTVTAPANGSFTNFASTSADTADPTPANNDGSDSASQVFTTIGELADIITLKSGETNVVAGTNFIYTVTLTNAGPSTASNVVVIDTLPTNTVFVSASSGGTLSNNVVTWPTLTSIPNLFSTNFTVTVTAPANGSFTNFASTTADTADPTPANNDGSDSASQVFTTVGELADIITLKSGETNVVAGTNFIYTVTLTNAGPSTASNVVVIDTLPTNTVFVSASSGGTLSNNVVSWPTLTSIPNLFSTNFTVTVTAPPSGSFTNFASTTADTADPTPANNDGSDSASQVFTTIGELADLMVTKLGPTTVSDTNTFVYSITLTNAGPSLGSNVVVIDTLPTNVVFVSASSGGTLSNNVVSWPSLAGFPVNASTNFTVTVHAISNGSITNVASGMSQTSDPDPTNNDGSAASARAITTVAIGGGGVSVSGFVYIDPNHNLQKDSGETGTGLSLFAKIFASTNLTGPALQALPVNATSGAFTLTNLAPGTYTVVIDNNNLLTDVTPTVPPGWSGTEMPNHFRNNVAVTTVNVPNQNFGLINSLSLAGKVFYDNGQAGGTANDGAISGGEGGIPGVIVRLTDSTGTTTYDTATTTGAGDYSLLIPSTLPNGTALKVTAANAPGHLSTGASTGTTAGSYDRDNDTVSFTLTAGSSYTGVNFGDVPVNSFTTDGQQTGMPGSFVVYPHTFTAGSGGNVTFSAAGLPAPSVNGWNQVIYRDANCNGQLDPTDPVITSPLTVVAEEKVCILVKEFIPSAAPFNARDQVTVTATFDYTGATPALGTDSSHINLTTVGHPTTSGLTLVQSVDKELARPGDPITYTLTFANNSAGILKKVVIYNETPAYTTFVSAGNGPLPNDLTGVILTAPSVGVAGGIRWTFAGTLAPGQTGTVTFTVTIDN